MEANDRYRNAITKAFDEALEKNGQGRWQEDPETSFTKMGFSDAFEMIINCIPSQNCR